MRKTAGMTTDMDTVHPVEFWLTREQVAQRLGISTRTVDRMLESGDLPRKVVSKRLVRIPASALEKEKPRDTEASQD